MKKLLFLFLFIALISCIDSDREQQYEPGTAQDFGRQNIATDAYGIQYPTLDPYKIYCGPGWGIKFCRFLLRYDGTIWADSQNYYSDFSDIMFSNFLGPYFISFFDLNGVASYCEGWKLGDTTYDGKKWNIKMKQNDWDVLSFDYCYYGSSNEIQYTITYKYEVIDGLLHFSSSDGKTFIFHPSEKNYSKDFVNTDKIIELEGCTFY